MITALTIIETMKKWVEEKHPIPPHLWLETSLKLNVLRGDVDDKLFELESDLAKLKRKLLSDENMTVAKADAIIRAEEAYKEMRKTNAQIKQIEEFIRISKKFSSLKEEEFISGR